MDTIKFDLVTPEAVFFSGTANQIDIPGILGEFGVLPGHAPIISGVRGGVVKVYTGKEQPTKLFVASGIAEVNQLSCTVLSERVIDLGAMTRADAEKNLSKVIAALDLAFDETSKADAVREVELAKAVLAEF